MVTNSAPVTAEELTAWRSEEVSLWVLEALEAMAAAQAEAWALASWERGLSDEKLLTELRTRADTFRSIAEADYTAFCAALNQDPASSDA